ncbi:unnamed protein product [Nippostrongylus brasiliensis]|uniref:ZP domain-containing protein n=1 Tax=Nippostrongylus brasiliensis TaxID=27835 RepID=A0A0N4YBP2_NIPBR|nr:hypothetical protein Q1695_000320 [Nippostrongylus brasiliensis]VDL77489.1 unnamed protein product [Nippostrongylus brasiliensis]
MIVEFMLVSSLFAISSTSRPSPPAEDSKHSTKPSAKCEFSVHKDGPDGEAVTGTALDVVLYYSIRCEEREGYCLMVANCTISSDEAGFKPYPIINENGCSLESSLYDDVTYESKFVAGIRNPYPVRFRSSSSSVLLYCVTTLTPTTMDGTCERHQCSSSS